MSFQILSCPQGSYSNISGLYIDSRLPSPHPQGKHARYQHGRCLSAFPGVLRGTRVSDSRLHCPSARCRFAPLATGLLSSTTPSFMILIPACLSSSESVYLDI
ncbi:hypothetical protein I7I53_05381 [Histoplasma capsulatum var. duboisii H88]|uniref:Uncharacterized protein n=1 Tax=Ajellomyces capsulatus (strain H88) TaxID=544711 RepID=A0A8A1LXV6_AJEC8|nr:hypothetical protein I7I53_05381 [Histoplasma capsulatum var. duboisii H88]